MKARGGSEQDYTDEVFGTVLDTSPLKIWISARLILSGDFLEVSALANELKVHVSLPITGTSSVNGKTEDNKNLNASGSISGTAAGDVIIWRGLQKGDKVRMLRLQKGQRYLVLERV